MANEITVQFNLRVAKNSVIGQINPSVRNIDQTSTKQFKTVQSLATSAEEILLGDVTSPRMIALRSPVVGQPNITVYNDSGGTQLVAVLNPEDLILLTNPGTLYAKSASSTADLEVLAFSA
jgi:hypothetical protein